MIETKTIQVADLRYKWQDSEPDLDVSTMHEKYLRSGLYRQGLRAAGRAGLADLFEDIRSNGVLHPLRVSVAEAGTYRVILGNQRLAIARALRITELLCEVYSPS
jgi:hypothetical protein